MKMHQVDSRCPSHLLALSTEVTTICYIFRNNIHIQLLICVKYTAPFVLRIHCVHGFAPCFLHLMYPGF